jgi:hypothetical protein
VFLLWRLTSGPFTIDSSTPTLKRNKINTRSKQALLLISKKSKRRESKLIPNNEEKDISFSEVLEMESNE